MQRSQNKKQWFWNVQTVKSPIRLQSIIEREHGAIWGAHHHHVFVVVKEILIHMSDGNQCATNKTLLFRVLKGCYYTPCYMDCFNKWNVNSVPNQPGVHGTIYSFSFFHVKMKWFAFQVVGSTNHNWMQNSNVMWHHANSCGISPECYRFGYHNMNKQKTHGTWLKVPGSHIMT